MGLSMTALTTEKIAAFAPIPSASVAIAAPVKPRFCRSIRRVYLRSLRKASTWPPRSVADAWRIRQLHQFLVFQTQPDLARARNNELGATLD
jgi:hypothetical protein